MNQDPISTGKRNSNSETRDDGLVAVETLIKMPRKKNFLFW